MGDAYAFDDGSSDKESEEHLERILEKYKVPASGSRKASKRRARHTGESSIASSSSSPASAKSKTGSLCGKRRKQTRLKRGRSLQSTPVNSKSSTRTASGEDSKQDLDLSSISQVEDSNNNTPSTSCLSGRLTRSQSRESAPSLDESSVGTYMSSPVAGEPRRAALATVNHHSPGKRRAKAKAKANAAAASSAASRETARRAAEEMERLSREIEDIEDYDLLEEQIVA